MVVVYVLLIIDQREPDTVAGYTHIYIFYSVHIAVTRLILIPKAQVACVAFT